VENRFGATPFVILSTAFAAKIFGRLYLNIELNEKYCRLREEISTGDPTTPFGLQIGA
jgi:hypothetical protein